MRGHRGRTEHAVVRTGELRSSSRPEATSFLEKTPFGHLDLSTEGDEIFPFAPRLPGPSPALPAPTLRAAGRGSRPPVQGFPDPPRPPLSHPSHLRPEGPTACAQVFKAGCLLPAPTPHPPPQDRREPHALPGAPRPLLPSFGFAVSLVLSVTLPGGACGELGHRVSRVGLCPMGSVSPAPRRARGRGRCSVDLSGRNEDRTSRPGEGGRGWARVSIKLGSVC